MNVVAGIRRLKKPLGTLPFIAQKGVTSFISKSRKKSSVNVDIRPQRSVRRKAPKLLEEALKSGGFI